MSATYLKFIPKMNYMANRPQRVLHEDEMETSELHSSVQTTP